MGALLVGRLGKSKQATIKTNWIGAVLVGREFVGGYLGKRQTKHISNLLQFADLWVFYFCYI